MTEDTTKLGVSRRTLAKGAAWSVPAVAVAAAAPAYAASPGKPPTWEQTSACKSPGNSCKTFPKGYKFVYKVCNPNAFAIDVTITEYTVTGTNLTLTPKSDSFTLGADACESVEIYTDSSNSANAVFYYTADYTYCRVGYPTDCGDATTQQFTVAGTPPECPCPATSPFSPSPEMRQASSLEEPKVEEPVVEEPKEEIQPVVEEKPVVEEPKEEIQPVIEAEVTEDAAAKTAPADAEADA